MTTTRRALWLAADRHSVDGDARPNPEGIFDQSLPELIMQILRILCGRGVAIIAADAAALMGLPTGKLPDGGEGRNWPEVQQLRAAGFTLKEVGRWFHVKHRDVTGPGVWFGLAEFLDADYFPLLGAAPEHLTGALAQWDRITGHVWQGSAGDAGNAILKAQTYKTRGKQQGAAWWSWDGPDGEPIEVPYLSNLWHRRDPSADVAYGYDRVRAYLSAMTCTKVAAESLRHTGLTAYAPQHAGWYLCELGPWELEAMMPDPAGYNAEPGARAVWLTHPTVALLDQLQAHGFYQYSVIDSWTAPATPLMTSYGKALREAWQQTRTIDDPAVKALVRAGIKGAYRVGHGYWRSKQSRVQRPDWAAAVTAMSRVNLWRRMFTMWAGTGFDDLAAAKFDGPAPLWIETDTVYYPHPIQADGWTVWDSERDDLDDVTELGQWRTGAVRRRKSKTEVAA